MNEQLVMSNDDYNRCDHGDSGAVVGDRKSNHNY